ncbi:CDP-alcohol phosphatidyltransferase family protein [Polycladidibacter stylochi]|uniref:CDP-alcohol phosphatidyltransferase family protein n=1 Tax=Polycladidibacter stylochi TaxID=1807766 RepID=UPI0008355045|nr:phosphatidylcholine synthase [Pseudovibrio stylochi]
MRLKNNNKLFAIHLLTALGAPLALLAVIAGAQNDLPLMFLWLFIALFVDGLDGPLARHFEVAKRLPRWSGAILDLVIDYATYVFLPAFALYQSGLTSDLWALICGSVIVYSGAIYFADGNMKTRSGGFSGFPGVWNMVIAVLIGLQASQSVILFMVALCTILTFLPVEFVHPVRTKMWRPFTLIVLAVWVGGLATSFAQSFVISDLVYWVITATSCYLFAAGALQQVIIGQREN